MTKFYTSKTTTIFQGRILKSKPLIILLFFSYYNKSDLKERQKEIDSVIEKNLKNPYINKIWLFVEPGNEPSHLLKSRFNRQKCNLIPIDDKPMYGDMFRYAQQNLNGQIVAITNTDNYFDETLKLLVDPTIDWNERMFFLTRLEDHNGNILDMEKCTRFYDSYDSFIFKSPLNNTSLLFSKLDKIEYGTEDVENIILKALYESNGIMGEDPCEFLRLYHHHHDDENREQHKAVDEKDIRSNYPLKISELSPPSLNILIISIRILELLKRYS
ncbi:hypothetical protein PPL_10158 [Heterostelium album PN500]|uniref:Uncharacterized protein n=1 Tax=Heterostelium pallidum (strain ATCC 26659 / Pp 5 / PN500) TaxID=670386 RepID=D3BQH3_HETP5|nr:hypothetical protein PPL_10158 [Heterostelium album PN500]EFA76393.1 hypothetical protein PPL_10158 [Heterostelium album PN500]|eukprot:XP_020428525.1 hypothetical protein PPL_10158 [Heterostelium album PN500]